MKNLRDKDILKIVKDVRDTASSILGIVTGVKDIIRMFKR